MSDTNPMLGRVIRRLRTESGISPLVSAGNGIFTLLGFMGMYLLMGVLFLSLVWREVERGPGHVEFEQPAPAHH